MGKIFTKPKAEQPEEPEEIEKSQIPDPTTLSLIFTAVFPKLIIPHSVFNIALFVEKSNQSVQVGAETRNENSALHFSAKITREEETFSTLKEISVAQGKSASLPINVPELKSATESEYKLILTVRDDAEENRPLNQETFEKKLFRRKVHFSLFAHTDKKKYKPGEPVKFRIVVLNPNWIPFSDDSESKVIVNVQIFDPDQNLVKMWTAAPTRNGIFSSEFLLSSDPIFGDWEIKYEALVKTQKLSQNEQEEQQEKIDSKTIDFSVQKYVLPKYKMTTKLPPYVSPMSDEKISVRVEVKYSHGGGVRGQVKLTPSFRGHFREDMEDENINPREMEQEEKENALEKILPIDDSGILETEIEYKNLVDCSKECFGYGAILVHIQFTDGVTGKKITKSRFVRLFTFPYKIKTWSEPWKLIKGIDYTVFIKLMMQDGAPITDEFRNRGAVQIIHKFPIPTAANSKEEKNPSIQVEIPAQKIDINGTTQITFDSNATSRVNREECKQFQVKFGELTKEHWISFHDDWPSLTVLVKNQETSVNQDHPTVIKKTPDDQTSQIDVTVVQNKPFQSLNYFISTTNKIVAFGSKDFPSMETIHQFQIPWPNTTQNHVPLFSDLSSLFSAGEKILHTLNIFIAVETIQMEHCYFYAKNYSSNPNPKAKTRHENFLDISLSKETREPGQNVTLEIRTGKNSLVALKAVDESVSILNWSPDINRQVIDAEKQSHDYEDQMMHCEYKGSPSIDSVEYQGLRAITNSPPYIPPPREFRCGRQPWKPECQENEPDPPVFFRKELSETWIWEESWSQNGTLNLSKMVPNSLTSWIITGFSISKELGIAALSEPKKLVVRTEFFLVLNLPYSVVQGETLHLQVMVNNHNSEKKEILAEITLDNSDENFEFSYTHEKKSSNSKSMSLKTTVKPDSTSFITFPIKPVKYGMIDLKVKGSVSGSKRSDALSQQLKVIPPGERESGSEAVLLSPTDKNIQIELAALFPETSIRLDDNLKISAIYDLLSSTIENMDNLIEMPSRCGEQNMLHFVVDIVVLEYLESYSSSSKTAPDLQPGAREKAIKFLELGYQRELSYRHKDGSFSCFGQSDPNGSTWLTAFVLRSFLKASAFITIDDQVINQAAEFLLAQQDENSGSFKEKRSVYDFKLVGSSGSKGVALTAFCLLALLQMQKQGTPKDQQDSASKTIKRGIDFILQGTKDNKAGTDKDLYALILTTYALHLADHKEKDAYFQKMETAARKEGDLMFWGHFDSDSSSLSDTAKAEAGNSKAKPVWIEMTGYALLIYMLRVENSNFLASNNLNMLPIVKWLLKHRNSKGGFISTQDTVVGLSALAQFAKATQTKDGAAAVDLNIVAKHGKKELKIKVNVKNWMVLQEFILLSSSKSSSSVSLRASGKGSALVQLSWYYFVQSPVKKSGFSLDVTALERNPRRGIALKICTSFILEGKESKSIEKSNMAIVEVNFPSGYSVSIDKEMLSSLAKLPNYRRHETENGDSRLNIYFESISKAPNPTCFELEGERLFQVANVVETYVSVYDYYEPTRRARTFYPLPISSTTSPSKKS